MRQIVGIDKTYQNAIYQNLFKQHKMFLQCFAFGILTKIFQMCHYYCHTLVRAAVLLILNITVYDNYCNMHVHTIASVSINGVQIRKEKPVTDKRQFWPKHSQLKVNNFVK